MLSPLDHEPAPSPWHPVVPTPYGTDHEGGGDGTDRRPRALRGTRTWWPARSGDQPPRWRGCSRAGPDRGDRAPASSLDPLVWAVGCRRGASRRCASRSGTPRGALLESILEGDLEPRGCLAGLWRGHAAAFACARAPGRWHREMHASGQGVGETVQEERGDMAEHGVRARPEPECDELVVLGRRGAREAIDTAKLAADPAGVGAVAQDLWRDVMGSGLGGGDPPKRPVTQLLETPSAICRQGRVGRRRKGLSVGDPDPCARARAPGTARCRTPWACR